MELRTRDTDEDFNKVKVLYNQRLFSEILATKESLLKVKSISDKLRDHINKDLDQTLLNLNRQLKLQADEEGSADIPSDDLEEDVNLFSGRIFLLLKESGKIDVVAETLGEFFNKDEMTARLESIYDNFDKQVFQKLLHQALDFAGKCDLQRSSEKLKAASQIQDYFT